MDTARLLEAARKALEADKARREEACGRELGELLERHGCKIDAVPDRVAGLWTFRIVIEAR